MRSMEPPSWRGLGAVCILFVLLISGATPSGAYQQDLKKMAAELAARIRAKEHSRVTVIDFVDLDSKPTRLGKFLALQLQANLAEPDLELVVVDQSHLSQLMDQIELLNDGLLDPTTGRKLGQMTGTEVIVRGTVMPSSMTVRLDVEVIDLQTAKMIAGVSESVARLGIIERLAKDASGEDEEEVAKIDADQKVQQVKRPAPQGPARSRSDHGMTFDLDGCSLSADTVTCGLTVTSDRDRWLSVSFYSRVWTEAGEEYGPSEIVIANSSSSDSCAYKQVLKNVPTRLSLTFPGLGEETGIVERLRFYWHGRADCWRDDLRAVNFDKIEFSDETYASSPQKSSRLGLRQSYESESAGQKKGGLLQSIRGRVLDAVEGAAVQAIDKQMRRLTGDEEEEDPKKKN